MRLIDAKDLYERIKEHHDLYVNAWGSFKNLPADDKARVDAYTCCIAEVVNSQTIDAVPVVRCKDCRYSEPMKKHGVCKFGENALNCTQCRGDDGYGYAGISVIHPDDYCSDGAPKDGEAHDDPG